MEERVWISEGNVDDCIKLYQHVFNSDPWNEGWNDESAKERLADLIHTPKFLGCSYYEDGEIVGFIAGNSKRTFNGLTFYIAELCVNNTIQGKGYGTRMLKAFEEELKKREIQSLYLLTAREGQAQAFYEKNGYAVNENRIVMKKSF